MQHLEICLPSCIKKFKLFVFFQCCLNKKYSHYQDPFFVHSWFDSLFILFVVEESVAYERIHNLSLSWQRFWKLMHEGLTDLIYCLSGPFPQVRLVIYYCFFCLVWFLYDKKKKKRERSRYKTTTTATKRQLIIKDHKSKGFEKRFKHTNRLSWMIKHIRTVLVAHFLLHLMFVLFLVSFLCRPFMHVCKIWDNRSDLVSAFIYRT